ncbi:MAG: DUF362 domain-containing protein [Clostridiales bacterium]|nr:DUF362 domain-containing protein [Clostridiales bacterium]
MTMVSVRRVAEYEEQALDQAISDHFEALHVAEDLTPDTRVLIKPNLLAARAPSQAVCTHPALVAAIARWLKKQGVKQIVLADSPGGTYNLAVLEKLYAVSGMKELEGLVTLNRDVTYGAKNGFAILTPILQADYIIDCAKCKTHGLTVMSGAVKNLFGCIPGLKKPEWHCKRPTVDGFSDLLIDLCETVRPNLTVLDAIDCMEGNGPGGGTVRHMGVTLCSRSPYAVDEQAAKLMGLGDKQAPIIRAARRRGFPADGITLAGDELPIADPPFVLPDAVKGSERFLTPNGLFHSFFGRRRSYPRVDTDRCVGCGRCAESCPQHIIEIKEKKAVLRRKGCISCFCCQEMCPAHAIGVVKRFL